MTNDEIELPEPAFRLRWKGAEGRYTVSEPNIGDTDCYTADQLRAAVEADRKRARAAEPVATIHNDGYWTHEPGKDPFDRFGPNAKSTRIQVYTAPARTAVTDLLSADDMRWLRRFQDICEDSGADGHDVPKAAMRQLEKIGVVRSCGFGRHETTAFGDYIIEAALGGGHGTV